MPPRDVRELEVTKAMCDVRTLVDNWQENSTFRGILNRKVYGIWHYNAYVGRSHEIIIVQAEYIRQQILEKGFDPGCNIGGLDNKTEYTK